MSFERIEKMRRAHKILCEFPFEIKELYRGYSDRILRIDLNKNEINILPVSQQMKELWTGGKGFDLWLMFQEIGKDTKWDSPENPICFSPGPLGGTTSFPGSGKTLVTAISPITESIIDCNVGGFFGPYMKFAGFDALVLTGKAKSETIIYIDAVNKKITIEEAPEESVDSHLAAEEFTEMYSDDDLDRRNIAVVSAGNAALHSRMGVLNFSFWDWRRNVARLKQAGRGGVGTVFRHKNMKALVIKSQPVTPAWRVEENKAAALVKPKRLTALSKADCALVDKIIEKWGNDPEFIIEILQDVQDTFHVISVDAITRIQVKTGVPKAYIYHMATFDPYFTLEPEAARKQATAEPVKFLTRDGYLLRAEGTDDPENLDTYKKNGGYAALSKYLNGNNPGEIQAQLEASQLRGRTGGILLSEKWQAALKAKQEKNSGVFLICPVDEGFSGAGADQALLKTHPHAVIEGLLLGAFALGAQTGYIAIGDNDPGASEILNQAATDATKAGFLGDNICGSGFSFHLHLHRNMGSVVNSEPTSIIGVLSGRAGDSQARYIPVTESGLKGQPTVVSSASTWAAVPKAVSGAGKSHSALFYLHGDVNKPGLAEVPLGTPLRVLIDQYGGGVKNGAGIKAIHVGGVSGAFIPASLSELPLNHDALAQNGAIMGTGDIHVLSDNNCLLEKVSHSISRLADKSCGKCTPCREGLHAMKQTLNRICDGKGQPSDLSFLDEIAATVRETSLCRFGQNAALPVQSALRFFKNELDGHLNGVKSGACCKSKG